MRLLFDRAPGVDTYYHENPDSPGFVLEKVFDREPVIEHCARMRNEVAQRGELRKVMSIPVPLFYQLMREGKLGEAAFVDGSCVVEPKALPRLMRELPKLTCVDKL